MNNPLQMKKLTIHTKMELYTYEEEETGAVVVEKILLNINKEVININKEAIPQTIWTYLWENYLDKKEE